MKQELLNELITSLGLTVMNVGEDIMDKKYEGLAVRIETLRELVGYLEGVMRMRRLGQ